MNNGTNGIIGVLMAGGLWLGVASGLFAADEQSITGEVVDVVCYVQRGPEGLGPKHAACGRKCVRSGLPVAIKAGDTLYLAVMADHTAANGKLAPFVGRQVEVTGQISEKDGHRMIAISDVRPH